MDVPTGHKNFIEIRNAEFVDFSDGGRNNEVQLIDTDFGRIAMRPYE